MADQQPQAPAPVPSGQPQPDAPAPAPAPASQGLTPAEEKQLAELQAKAATASAQGRVVEFRIAPDGAHESMTHAGIQIVRDRWTEVPERLAGAMLTAAADAGVAIEQKEG